MADTKSAAEQFAEQQAREAIGQRYIDPATLDPDRQEQLDKNRVPGQLDPTFDPSDDGESSSGMAPVAKERSLSSALKQRPLRLTIGGGGDRFCRGADLAVSGP